MTDPIAAHLAAVRRDRYSDATLTARVREVAEGHHIPALRGNAKRPPAHRRETESGGSVMPGP